VDPLDELGVLVNRHVVNQNIFDSRADEIPVGAVVFQPAQNQRIALHDLHSVVVKHLFADCNNVGGDIGIGIPTGPQWIGDDARTLTGRDEKKIVTEILNRRVHIGCIGEPTETTRDIRITARCISGSARPEQRLHQASHAKDHSESCPVCDALHGILTHDSDQGVPARTVASCVAGYWIAT
jgi:hypothetical protein